MIIPRFHRPAFLLYGSKMDSLANMETDFYGVCPFVDVVDDGGLTVTYPAGVVGNCLKVTQSSPNLYSIYRYVYLEEYGQPYTNYPRGTFSYWFKTSHLKDFYYPPLVGFNSGLIDIYTVNDINLLITKCGGIQYNHTGLSAETWCHILCLWDKDGLPDGDTHKLYVNGSLVGSSAATLTEDTAFRPMLRFSSGESKDSVVVSMYADAVKLWKAPLFIAEQEYNSGNGTEHLIVL